MGFRNSIVTFSMEKKNSRATKLMEVSEGVFIPTKNVRTYLNNLHKQTKQLSIMAKVAKKGASTKGSSAKAKSAKVTKEKVLAPLTRKDFPVKGFGLSPKGMDQLAAVGIKNGYRNMTQVVRAALAKAFGIKDEE